MSKTPPPAISTQLSISSKTNTPLTTPAGTPGKKSRESGASKLIKAPAVAASKSVKKTDVAPDPNSAVALAASKGRKKLPGGGEDDGKTGSRKNAGTKKAPKQEKKKKKGKRQPKMHPILMYLGYGPDVVLRDRRALEVAQGLDLRQWHLRFLKANFDKVDIDGAGTLDASELFESVGEVRTPLTDKLFEVLDMHPNSIVEFDDYVRVVCTYCMFTKDEILRFCFRCFDHDDSGTIDEKEFCELCKVVNNAAPLFPGNFARALDEFDVNEDGLIDYAEFVELDRRYPLILFPAFKLQDHLQKHTLGEHAWVGISEEYHKRKRIEDYKAAHGGKMPPEGILTRVSKLLFPCLFTKKTHIKIGGDIMKNI